MFRRLLLIGFGILFFSAVTMEAQHDELQCGTHTTPQESQVLDEFFAQYDPTNIPESRTTRYVPITVHAVSDDDGSNGVSVARILDNVCNMQQFYNPVDFVVYLNEINQVKNTIWNGASGVAALAGLNKKPTSCNIFSMRTLDNPTAAGYYTGGAVANGTTSGTDCIFIRHSYTSASIQNARVWSHELGHYMSLPHTFGSIDLTHSGCAPGSYERYTRTGATANCNSAGDRFCDTYPDYLYGGFNCSGSSGKSQQSVCDADGTNFNIDGKWIMSYSSRNNCPKDSFSQGQIDAMHFMLTNKRSNLNPSTAPNYQPITVGPDLNFPKGGSTTPYYNYVDFDWEDVPNAKQYIVEIYSNLVSTGSLVAEGVVTDSWFRAEGLNPGGNYIWRAFAINPVSFCNPIYSAQESFKTSFFTGTESLSSVEKFVVYPNPSKGANTLTIDFASSEQLSGYLKIQDVTGRELKSQIVDANSGSQYMELDIASLTTGLYFVQLQTTQGTITRKVMITAK